MLLWVRCDVVSGSVGERWVAWVDRRQAEARRRREANKPRTLQQQCLRLAYRIMGPITAVMILSTYGRGGRYRLS